MRETLHGHEREASEWRYDARGQVEKVWHYTASEPGGPRQHAEWYAYDALGNLTQQQQEGRIWAGTKATRW